METTTHHANGDLGLVSEAVSCMDNTYALALNNSASAVSRPGSTGGTTAAAAWSA